METHICGSIFNKGAKIIQWRKNSLFNKWSYNKWIFIYTCKKRTLIFTKHHTQKQHRQCLMLKLNEKADWFRSRTAQITVRYSWLFGVWQIKPKGHLQCTFTVLLMKQNGRWHECQHNYLKLFYIHVATWLHMFKLSIRKQMKPANAEIKRSEPKHLANQKIIYTTIYRTTHTK